MFYNGVNDMGTTEKQYMLDDRNLDVRVIREMSDDEFRKKYGEYIPAFKEKCKKLGISYDI